MKKTRLTTACAVVVLVLPAISGCPQPEEGLEGLWTGRLMLEGVQQGVHVDLRFGEDGFYITQVASDGETTVHLAGSYVADESFSPGIVNMSVTTTTEAFYLGATLCGIYHMDGGELRLAFDVDAYPDQTQLDPAVGPVIIVNRID